MKNISAPSFLSGFSRGLASPLLLASYLFPDQAENDLTPEQRDWLSMRSDWEAVGTYLNEAIEQYPAKHLMEHA